GAGVACGREVGRDVFGDSRVIVNDQYLRHTRPPLGYGTTWSARPGSSPSCGGRGGIRTLKPVRAADFKSAVYAIPPLARRYPRGQRGPTSAHAELKKLEAAPGFEPGVHGFANRCLTNLAMPPRHTSVSDDSWSCQFL